MLPLIKVPFKKLAQVQAAPGLINVIIDMSGECLSCRARVLFSRQKPGDQWVPIIQVKGDEQYEIHKCEGELRRNRTLRRLIYGEEKPLE